MRCYLELCIVGIQKISPLFFFFFFSSYVLGLYSLSVFLPLVFNHLVGFVFLLCLSVCLD